MQVSQPWNELLAWYHLDLSAYYTIHPTTDQKLNDNDVSRKIHIAKSLMNIPWNATLAPPIRSRIKQIDVAHEKGWDWTERREGLSPIQTGRGKELPIGNDRTGEGLN